MNKKILIGIPTAKYIEPETFKAIYDLEVPDGYEVDFQYFYGYNIDQVRNLIASWAMRYDYLFSVDSDMSFPKETLKWLLQADKDIVSGVYRQRLPEQAIEIYDLNQRRMQYEDIYLQNMVRIGGCGMGCVLIKSEVFRAIPYPQFQYHAALDHANTFSEDLDFCRKATIAGFEIWTIPSLTCGHHGSTTFSVEVNKQSSVQKRLEDLSKQRLLPGNHIGFLHHMKTKGYEFKNIYDLGSCVLHWTSEAEQVWPEAKFHLVEAMDEVKFLYDRTPHDYYLGVLSKADGEFVTFNQNLEHPGGNSYYSENPDLSPLADQLWTEDNKVLKMTSTLDSVAKAKGWAMPDLIKMDVQGAELDVLQGSEQCLKSANALILELQHKDYNLGAPKRDEVIAYLETLGFKCEGMFCGSDLDVDGDYFFTKS